MAMAGYCNQCRQNVWLTPTGSCPNGHGPQDISSVYEAGPPPQTGQSADNAQRPVQYPVPPGQTPEPRKRNAGVVIGVVALVVFGLIFVCGILSAIAIPVLSGGSPSSNSAYPDVNGTIPDVNSVVPNADGTIPDVNSAKSKAQEQACLANQKMIEAASQAYFAERGEPPRSIDDLVDAGLISAESVCPSGGTYTWDSTTGRITCSVHGSCDTGDPGYPPQ